MHRAEQHLALFGQDEAAGMAVEERRAEIVFERADLAADRRLAQAQRLAGVGEGAGVGGRLKDAQLVPVHGRSPPSPNRSRRRGQLSRRWGGYSAACLAGASCAASQRSASSAAMQPSPAAVTAWRNTSSATSPAANTPSTLVSVDPGFVCT